jgi:hypothetical protein
MARPSMFVHYGLLIKQMFVSVVIKSSAHGRLFTYMLLPTADDAFFWNNHHHLDSKGNKMEKQNHLKLFGLIYASSVTVA